MFKIDKLLKCQVVMFDLSAFVFSDEYDCGSRIPSNLKYNLFFATVYYFKLSYKYVHYIITNCDKKTFTLIQKAGSSNLDAAVS